MGEQPRQGPGAAPEVGEDGQDLLVALVEELGDLLVRDPDDPLIMGLVPQRLLVLNEGLHVLELLVDDLVEGVAEFLLLCVVRGVPVSMMSSKFSMALVILPQLRCLLSLGYRGSNRSWISRYRVMSPRLPNVICTFVFR